MSDVLDLRATASQEQLDHASIVVKIQVLDAIERELAHMGADYATTVVRLSEAYRNLDQA